MKIHDLLAERVSVRSLETSPRIDKTPTIGYWAILQGKKLAKSNLLSHEEAKEALKTYHQVKPELKSLRIAFITK
jgi:hypothetical protein